MQIIRIIDKWQITKLGYLPFDIFDMESWSLPLDCGDVASTICGGIGMVLIAIFAGTISTI